MTHPAIAVGPDWVKIPGLVTGNVYTLQNKGAEAVFIYEGATPNTKDACLLGSMQTGRLKYAGETWLASATGRACLITIADGEN